MASSSINVTCPSTKSIKSSVLPVFSSVLSTRDNEQKVYKSITSTRRIVCSAIQESSTSTVTAKTKESEAVDKEAPAKPKPKAAKAPVKPLLELMEEDVIPPLKAILEAQDDLSDIELSFNDNRLEGSFLKNETSYSFWAFFPDGVLTGPRGFSLATNGTEVSTVEPFLVDEKKITGKLVVFWVEKRLAAQGILPVWKEDQ